MRQLLSVALLLVALASAAPMSDYDIQLVLKNDGFLDAVDGIWGSGSQSAFDKWAAQKFENAFDGTQSRYHKMFAEAYAKHGAPKGYLLGRFSPEKHPEFEKVTQPYCSHGGCGKYLRKDALAAYKRMADAARADGVTLKIRSATRDFNNQKWIWMQKWSGAKLIAGKDLSVEYPDHVDRARRILRYSSMPGTSRHHWGTDVDINEFLLSYWRSEEGQKVYNWLKVNADRFGFCQPFSPGRSVGYQEEAWHYSYMPVAKGLLNDYLAEIKPADISGFPGSETAEALNVIPDFVGGINQDCQNSEWNPEE